MRRVAVAGMIAVLAGFAAAACGNDPAASPTAPATIGAENTVEASEPAEGGGGGTGVACEVLTLDVVKQVLGDAAKEIPMAPPSEVAGSTFSQCVYAAGDKSVGVDLYRPKTDEGRTLNQLMYDGVKEANPDGLEMVPNYGAAQWSKPLGKLFVITDDRTHVIVTVSGGTLDDAKKIADAVLDKL